MWPTDLRSDHRRKASLLTVGFFKKKNMCLYTKMMKNKKYEPNKKNGGTPPKIKDIRHKYVPVKCGKCIECLKQKSREWQQRLGYEIQKDNSGRFVTLTFEEKWIEKLIEEDIKIGKLKDKKPRRIPRGSANSIAILAVRRFTERWREKYRKTIKHWLITELGHKGTERLHLHGIIFTNENQDEIREKWKYGNIQLGYSMNMKCINYIVKYVTKPDNDHPGFTGKIMTSKGIGDGFLETYDAKLNQYQENGQTREYIKLSTGVKTALSRHYRNKIYTEAQKEKLWSEKLDKGEIFVMGYKIKGPFGNKEHINALKWAQHENTKLGYGTAETRKKEYMAKDGKIYEINLENKK